MRKDLSKIFSRTLLTYWLILISIFILKMFGFDYFGIDTNNEIVNKINNIVINLKLEYVWYGITLFINGYVIMSITCNDNSKNMKLYTLLCTPLFILFQYLKTKYNAPFLFSVFDLLYLFILSLCYIKIVNEDKLHRYNISNYFLFMGLSFIYQLISLLTRGIKIDNNHDILMYIILNFDFIILLIITYKLYFIKGGNDLWVEVHSYCSDQLISLKKLPTKLQKSYQLAKPKTRQDELANKIYILLFWLYNFLSVAIILFVATLNHTFIECVFILSSFWINKGSFGKPFHLKKASTCFIVSNICYYSLNRMTWKIGISFLIPIILGLALSYITSKIMDKYMNKNTLPLLYKGIPEKDFDNITKHINQNKMYIDICKDFYVYKMSDVKLSLKYNYSIANIKKIKQRINKQIREQ